MKLFVLAASAAFTVASSAFADDQQLQNRLQLQQMQMERDRQTTTVGIYAQGQGIGSTMEPQSATETRHELRTDNHGHTFGLFVPETEPMR